MLRKAKSHTRDRCLQDENEMNPTYPKRLVNIISIYVLVLCLLAIAGQVGHLRSNLANLSDIDKQTTYLAMLFVTFVITCCIGSLKREYWSWIGVTSYLIYSTGEYIVDSYKYGIGVNLLIIVIPAMIIVLAILIFFFNKDVTRYFKVSNFHKFISVIIAIVAYLIIARNPNPNTEIVNFYYIDIIEEKHVLNGEIYTGKIFSNHPNGTIEFEGQIKNGKEEGNWKFYHDNGAIKNTVEYISGLPNGKDLTYFSNGTLREEKYYLNGKLEGEYKLWYDKDKLDVTGSFKSGKKHGEWRKYELEVIKIDKYRMDTIIETEYLEIENPAENK